MYATFHKMIYTSPAQKLDTVIQGLHLSNQVNVLTRYDAISMTYALTLYIKKMKNKSWSLLKSRRLYQWVKRYFAKFNKKNIAIYGSQRRLYQLVTHLLPPQQGMTSPLFGSRRIAAFVRDRLRNKAISAAHDNLKSKIIRIISVEINW